MNNFLNLKLLSRYKQNLLAFFILLVFLFNACENPFYMDILRGDSKPSDSKPVNFTPNDFTPMYFYVDCDGNFTETDLGRTVVIPFKTGSQRSVTGENPQDVVFYSDDASTYQRVALAFDNKKIIFFFQGNENFPTGMALSDSEEPFAGFFSQYNTYTQTYDITFVQDGEEEILSNIALSKDIFMQYEDDPELTQSQNLRMRNLYIAMCIYLSFNDFLNSEDTPQARFLWGLIRSGVKQFWPSPYVDIVLGAFQLGIGVGRILVGDLSGVTDVVGGLAAVIVGVHEELSGGPIVVNAPSSPPVAVIGIFLDRTSANITVGSAVTLVPSITPSNATNRAVTFRSSNTAVAEVGINGVVTGRSVGSATITVTTADGSRTASSTVTVGPRVINVTGVSLDRSSANIIIGNTITLTSTVSPADATNKTVNWSSSNVAVATVSSDGTVTGHSAGSATITVTSSDGNRRATCLVTVVPQIHAQTPNIINQPASATVAFGTVRNLSVSANVTGGGSLSFQWYSNTSVSNTGGETILEARSVSYSPPISTVGTFYYFVEVTNTISNNGDGGNKTATIKSDVATLTINKASGATVSAPILNTRTHNNIIINTITAPSTGQDVEYGISSSNNANTAAWQTGTAFSGLNAAATYFIFARSAGNNNYETGTASGSLSVTTLQTVSVNRFEYYWIDEHGSLVTTSGGLATVPQGGTLTITAQSTGYIVRQWHLNGLNTGHTGNSYDFSSTVAGKHIVGLFVEKNGQLYNTKITITVQ